jgi:hypothetical protein
MRYNQGASAGMARGRRDARRSNAAQWRCRRSMNNNGRSGEMKDLGDGTLPMSNSELNIYFDEEEDVVVVQLDYMDFNFYSADFLKLVNLLNRARLTLESDMDDATGEEGSEE